MITRAIKDEFETLFVNDRDPWCFESSWYEARKCNLLLASLPHSHFRAIFEPGCASGFLSQQLAQRCDQLLAWDGAQSAVAYTAERLSTFPGARTGHGWVPEQWPESDFDLIVLSEMVYYLNEHDISHLAERCRTTLNRSGPLASLVACHWRHPFDGAPLGGERVHEILNSHLRIPHVARWRDEDFCLDVWCVDPQTPAQLEQR